MARVKICGIRDAAAFDAAVATGADWIGFVFYRPSPRFVTATQAAALSSRHAGGPQRVGLFVEPTDAEIAAVVSVLKLDVLQIYAAAERAGELRRRFQKPVWHAVAITSAADLPQLVQDVDALLLEPRAPPGAAHPGGNAQSFDWSMLGGWRAPSPWILAGGLTPSTVAQAIRISGASAVDVSSGVERSRGIKDPALIAAFVAAARHPGAARSG